MYIVLFFSFSLFFIDEYVRNIFFSLHLTILSLCEFRKNIYLQQIKNGQQNIYQGLGLTVKPQPPPPGHSGHCLPLCFLLSLAGDVLYLEILNLEQSLNISIGGELKTFLCATFPQVRLKIQGGF